MAQLYVSKDSIILERDDGKKVFLSNFCSNVGQIHWGFFWFQSKIDGLYGYMDEEGKILRDAKYLTAGDFDSSLHAPVSDANGAGFIDYRGLDSLEKIKADRVWKFNNGFGKMQYKNRIFYIDKDYNKVEGDVETIYIARLWLAPRDRNLT